MRQDEEFGKYFVTMLVTLNDGRGEREILDNTPWSGVKRTQKGTVNLRNAISKLLAAKIQGRSAPPNLEFQF